MRGHALTVFIFYARSEKLNYLYFCEYRLYNKLIMGRPSKLNEELIELMASKLRKGLPISSCCDLLEITDMSHSNWMSQGKDDADAGIDSLFSRYFYTIKKARAEFEEIALDDIRSGRPGWQGCAWVLERTNQKYMPKQEFVAEEGKVQVVLGGKIKDIKRNDSAK